MLATVVFHKLSYLVMVARPTPAVSNHRLRRTSAIVAHSSSISGGSS